MPAGNGRELKMNELTPGNYYLMLRRPKKSTNRYVYGRYKYLGDISAHQRLFINEVSLSPFFVDDEYETNEYKLYHVIRLHERQALKDKEALLKERYLRGSNSSVNSSSGGRRRKTLRKKHKHGTRKVKGSPN
jgi:hypothetical protein